ncbi:MAG TPA: ABC transporter permease [Thermodesulfobacteriota bacterium]|nr:ABC transporter permease [Thermodesulfobacteriota bacterium]
MWIAANPDPTMDLLTINLLNGISFGMILFLLAMGLSITLGVMGILNLAHGALFMIGGFIALNTANSGGNFWLAIALGSIGAGVFGLIIERLFLSRLYQQLDNQVLLTLGLVYIIGNVALWIYGGRVQLFDSPPVLTWKISIGNYAFPFYRIFLIGVGVVAFIVLWWLVERTRIGSIVRAGMDNKDMTRALGINYSLTCTAVFALGAFVGGFAGSVATPLIGVFQSMALDILLFALIVVVVGGPGSVLGTLIGALIIGLVDAFGKAFFPDLAMFTMYLVLILMLLIKPSGILGRTRNVEGTPPGPTASATPCAARGFFVKYGPYFICFLAFMLLPPLLPRYLQSMATKIVIFSVFALSLNLIWGYTGLISLGHATYFGVGAYTSTILIVRMGIGNFWVAGFVAVIVAGFLAAIYGIIALRVVGLYFLLVTLALGQLVFCISTVWRSVTGGDNGIIGTPFPELGIPGFTVNSVTYYYLVLIVAVVCFFLLYRLVNSPFGYALQGIRDDEKKMRTLGYNTWLYKYLAFVIAGIFAAVSGVLFSYFLVVVGPPQLSMTTSTMAILMVIIGSTRVFWGPVAGSIVVILLEYIASLYVPERWPLILGAIFVIAVMFLREGIGSSLTKLWRRLAYLDGSLTS